jgi:hypothetical protein
MGWFLSPVVSEQSRVVWDCYLKIGHKFDPILNIEQETDSEQVALAKVAKNSEERVKSS